jgi:hypothetical protein
VPVSREYERNEKNAKINEEGEIWREESKKVKTRKKDKIGTEVKE